MNFQNTNKNVVVTNNNIISLIRYAFSHQTISHTKVTNKDRN